MKVWKIAQIQSIPIDSNLLFRPSHPPTIDMGRNKSKARSAKQHLLSLTSLTDDTAKITTLPCPPPYDVFRSVSELLIEKVAPVAVALAVDCSFTKSPIFTVLVAIFALLEFKMLVFDFVRSSGWNKMIAGFVLLFMVALAFGASLICFVVSNPDSLLGRYATTFVDGRTSTVRPNYGYDGPLKYYSLVLGAYTDSLFDGFWKEKMVDDSRWIFCSTLMAADLGFDGGQSCAICAMNTTPFTIANCLAPRVF